MVSSTPERWRAASNREWFPVDEVEFITMILANGSWDTDTIGPVEIAFGDSGFLLWRDLDVGEGGGFPADKVVHVEWAT